MKKIILSILVIIIFSAFVRIQGEGSHLELVDYVRTDGTQVKHYGTDQNVQMPSQFFESKFQTRAAWVATVYNIDFKQVFSEKEFISEYNKLLDSMQSFNLNTIYFQVRPMLDAFYPSNYNPWSEYLSGMRGKDPGYDPLKYMIEETHRRGMNFHAWLNPYRVSKDFSGDRDVFFNSLAENNFARLNRDKVLVKGKDMILNPAEPAVIQYILNTVQELCDNYDLDGINFDDYFYLSNLSTNEDNHSYLTYKTSNPLGFVPGLSVPDFRRENVNYLISKINDLMSERNQINERSIKFGISPAGVWASKRNHPDGANVQGGYECYTDLYADIRKWILNDWIDYVSPQIYFGFLNRNNPYADILEWWSKTVEGTNVLLNISLAIYMYDEDSPWTYKNEIRDQLTYNQKFENVTGITFFSMKTLRSPKKDLTKAVVEDLKTMMSKKVIAPTQKSNKLKDVTLKEAQIYHSKDQSILKIEEVENAYGYVLYQKEKNQALDYNDLKNFITSFRSVPNAQYTEIKIPKADFDKYDYVVRPVSVDGREKENEILINQLAINEKPSTVQVNIGDNSKFVFNPREKVIISFNPATDPENDLLIYKVLFSFDGSFFTTEYKPILTEGVYQFEFDVFTIETTEGVFKVIISDGTNEVECLSEKITITKTPIDNTTTTTPTEPDNTTTEGSSKSCKVNKQISAFEIIAGLLFTISLMGSSIVLIKRK